MDQHEERESNEFLAKRNMVKHTAGNAGRMIDMGEKNSRGIIRCSDLRRRDINDML